MSHREVAKDQPPNIHIKLNREKKGGTRADEISSRVCVVLSLSAWCLSPRCLVLCSGGLLKPQSSPLICN